MPDLPELNKSGDSLSGRAKKHVKKLCWWLPDPFECPECNVYCDSTVTYQPQRAAFYPHGMAPSWTCPSCKREYIRDRE